MAGRDNRTGSGAGRASRLGTSDAASTASPDRNRYTSAESTGAYSHDDFTYVRRKRGRMSAEGGGEDEGEINIVPYLDIMINLIMFMLVAQTTVVSLGMIDVTAPTYASTGPGPSPAPAEENTKRLKRLTVGVAQKGFYIAAQGGVLPGQTEESTTTQVTAEGVNEQPPTVPLLADGSYDFRTLGLKMRGIKNAFPDTKAVYVAADNSIPYEIIVKTLDITREDARGELFPAVAFTQIN